MKNSLAWKFVLIGILILPLIPLLGIVGLFLALIITWQLEYKQMIKQRLIWGFAVLAMWLIFTSCFAFKPTEAFLGLANFLPFFPLLAIFGVLIRQESQLRQLAWMMVIPSFPIVILGLGQLFAGWSFPYILGWELVPYGNPSGRMSSVFIYTNFLAIYLVIVFNLALGLWLDVWKVWRESFNRNQGKVLLFLSLILIFDSLGLVLTSSRNAWGIAFLVCLGFAFYLRWYLLFVPVLTSAGIILWSAFGLNPSRDALRVIIPKFIWGRLSDELYPDRPLETLRITQWRFALDMGIEKPWLGWGLRNFTPLYEAEWGLWLGHPHNIFVMLIGEIGIIGGFLFSFLVGWIVFNGFKLINRFKDKDIIFAYCMAFSSCILFNLLDVSIYDLRVNTLGWVLLGVIWGSINLVNGKSLKSNLE